MAQQTLDTIKEKDENMETDIGDKNPNMDESIEEDVEE